MQVPSDNVVIKMEKTVDDEYRLKNGKVIYLDTNKDWQPPEGKAYIKPNLIVCAEAIQVPHKLADKHRLDVLPVRRADDVRVHRDVYNYYPHKDYFMDSIAPEVEKGDLIYFNWTAINNSNLFPVNGQEAYYKVPYPDIICAIKEGNIIPIGGNLLLKPYYGEGEHRKLGNLTQFGYKNEKGLFILCKPLEGYGRIVYTGTPLKGDPVELEAGYVVKYNSKMGFNVKIEEEEYINIKYWDIEAAFEKVA